MYLNGLPGYFCFAAFTVHFDCASLIGASKTTRYLSISTTRLLCEPPCTCDTPGATSTSLSPPGFACESYRTASESSSVPMIGRRSTHCQGTLFGSAIFGAP